MSSHHFSKNSDLKYIHTVANRIVLTYWSNDFKEIFKKIVLECLAKNRFQGESEQRPETRRLLPSYMNYHYIQLISLFEDDMLIFPSMTY
jgi:hypothetical protein